MSRKEALANLGVAGPSQATDADMVQAFRDVAKGERTAQLLETSLTSVEKKIDALLASVEDPPKANSETDRQPTAASAEQMMNGINETKPVATAAPESRPELGSARDSTGMRLPIMGATDK